MGIRRSFDTTELITGYCLLAYAVMVLTIFLLEPFDFESMTVFAAVTTLIALAFTLYFCFKALALYGRNSNEGKVWFKIILTMLLLAIGLALSEIISYEYRPFAICAIFAFILVAWAILERLRNAGLKPRLKDVAIASTLVILISIFISLVMSHLSERGLRDVDINRFWLELTVVFIAFVVTFLSSIMGSLMGGHLSKGWYFFALGSAIFSITYTFIVVLRALDLYADFLFIETFQVMALNSVTFSAYLQRKRHLEMIENI